MKIIILITLILFYLQNAHAKFRYVIYTDQNPPTKGREVKKYFENTKPFDEFQIEFKIVNLSTKELSCGQ